MSARVVSDVDRNGRLVARKRSRDHLDAERLRHEAEVLTAARHPGVVELVHCVGEGDDVELATAYLGSHSLATLPPLGVDRAAGIVAAVAETVADLHDLGLVHGRIDPSHVLLGPGGRPVLCGFAGGGRIGTTPPPGPALAPGSDDPAATDDAVLTPEIDVHGLGELLRTSLADSSDEAEPVPERRVSLSRVRPRWIGYQRRALLTLADQATDDIPLRRPPARRLAADILSVVPSATIAESVDPYAGLRPTALDAASDRRRTNRVAAFVAIALGAVMILFGLSGTHPSRSAAASPPVAVADSSPEVNPTVTAPPVTVGPDGVIVAGGQRYTVGEAGDQIATGDFDCNGSSTLALLRPRTGGIFVFDGWATAGDDVSIGPTTVVPGAVALAVQNDGECPVLLAVLADGSEQEVKL